MQEQTLTASIARCSCRNARATDTNGIFKFLACMLIPVMITLGCSDQDKQTQPVSRPVKVFRITDQSSTSRMSLAGEVRARYETILSFRVAGKLVARRVDVGDHVVKGQTLAILDDNDFQLSIRNLQSQLAAIVAERDFLRDDLERYRDLLIQKVISLPEFQRHDTTYTAKREQAAALKAQLDLAANQLSYTELKADRDGVVTALEVEIGQVIGAGQAIVKLARLDEKEIHFDIPEHRLSEITRGQEITVSLWSNDSQRFNAHIREVAATADPASRTYRVKAALSKDLKNVQLGMTATAWVPSKRTDQLPIPLSAVFTPQSQPTQKSVWLVDEATNSVKLVPIRLGETLDQERILAEGLAPGQLLISAGVQRLLEGQRVRWSQEGGSTTHGQSTENKSGNYE